MSPSSRTSTSAAIAAEDLALMAEVAMMRFPLRAAESLRLERMRTVIDAAADLARRLEAHTHCALVNYRGTHGTGDLAAESEALAEAFQRYGRLLAETAIEYGRAGRPVAMPADAFPDALGRAESARAESWGAAVAR